MPGGLGSAPAPGGEGPSREKRDSNLSAAAGLILAPSCRPVTHWEVRRGWDRQKHSETGRETCGETYRWERTFRQKEMETGRERHPREGGARREGRGGKEPLRRTTGWVSKRREKRSRGKQDGLPPPPGSPPGSELPSVSPFLPSPRNGIQPPLWSLALAWGCKSPKEELRQGERAADLADTQVGKLLLRMLSDT